MLCAKLTFFFYTLFQTFQSSYTSVLSCVIILKKTAVVQINVLQASTAAVQNRGVIMANIHDLSRNQFMLKGSLRKKGYDWWWHSFTAYHEKTGAPRSFFIEFYTCNPASSGKNPRYGQLGDFPSYIMVKCGTWGKDAVQLHRFFAWNQVKVKTGTPFSIYAQDCFLNETHTAGSVSVTSAKDHPEWMCGNGTMRWNLKIQKQIAFHVGYGTCSLFRMLNAFEMYWHAEGMKTAYSGWVEFNGQKYLVRPKDCYGYADKNWGSDFTSPWVWLSSNHLTSLRSGKKLQDSVFDIGGGRPRVFGIPLNRKLLSSFWYEGKNYEFNFSKFWTFTRTRFACRETDTQIIWHVEQKNIHAKMITDISCLKQDMLLINYEAPNGKKLHNRLWNGGTGRGTVKLYRRYGLKYKLIDKILAENTGCEFGEYDSQGR